jgi:(p)ppGpp synthase/HD superfamily hydrolase
MNPEYLGTMPLHAITEVYGEAGLRERFALETAGFPPAARERLSEALALASELHADDRRVREPYVNHLLRVTVRIICYYRVRDVDVLVAALLHDAVEDHADELGGTTEAALATLAARFGPRVAQLVGAVTNPAEWAPDRHRYEQYREHVAHSLEADPWARVIKISDFTDNGVGLIHTTGPKLHAMAAKYAPLVPVLQDLVTRPDTPLADDVKVHIAGQLSLARRRFAAILGST